MTNRLENFWKEIHESVISEVIELENYAIVNHAIVKDIRYDDKTKCLIATLLVPKNIPLEVGSLSCGHITAYLVPNYNAENGYKYIRKCAGCGAEMYSN